MKASIILIIICVCCAFEGQAQRYLPEQKGIEISYGTVDNKKIGTLNDNYYLALKYSVYNKNKSRWILGGEYLKKQYVYKEAIIPKEQYTVEGAYYLHCMTAFRQTLFLSAGASILAGYETSNKGEKLLYNGATLKHADGMIYGGALGLEAELFISNQVVLLLHVRERILGGAITENFQTQTGIGIKFILN